MAADDRPAKAADDRPEAVAPEAVVVSIAAAADRPLAEHQRQPVIGVATAVVIVIAVVVVVIVIAATAEADAKVVDATSVTTGVAAAIADVVGPREERAQAKADADVVAADVEREAAAKVAKDRRTTTSTILTTEPPVGVCGSRRSLCSLGHVGGARTWWPPRGPLMLPAAVVGWCRGDWPGVVVGVAVTGRRGWLMSRLPSIAGAIKTG
ncbi:MAG TPA: hypothetical protein VM869_07570 [Enhygromyxa sp.]|nr:hypothetical protein [Enhygromyxa sp.]